MSKKNFTGGLNSLLGDQPEKPKRGRPVTQTKEITKSSQEGTKEKETRATFIAVSYTHLDVYKRQVSTTSSSSLSSSFLVKYP